MADQTINDIAARVTLTGTTKLPVGDGTAVQKFTDLDDIDDFFVASKGASRIIMSAIGTTAGALNNVNTAQAAFPTGQQVVTLDANTSYLFEGRYFIASGTVTHTTGMAFLAAGGLTIQTSGCEYVTFLTSGAANAIVTTSSTKHNTGLGTNVLNATSTAARTIIAFEGTLRINVGGTLTPQIVFSAAPGGTNQMLPGSYIRFTPFGTTGTSTIAPATGRWA